MKKSINPLESAPWRERLALARADVPPPIDFAAIRQELLRARCLPPVAVDWIAEFARVFGRPSFGLGGFSAAAVLIGFAYKELLELETTLPWIEFSQIVLGGSL